MVYRRPKGIDEGEDVSNITPIPLEEIENAPPNHEDFVFPEQRNALTTSEAGRIMINAKNKSRESNADANRRIDALIQSIDKLRVSDERCSRQHSTEVSRPTRLQDEQIPCDQAATTNYSTSYLSPESTSIDLIEFSPLMKHPAINQVSSQGPYTSHRTGRRTPMRDLSEGKGAEVRQVEATSGTVDKKPRAHETQQNAPSQFLKETPPNQTGWCDE